ncbi:MAG: thioredoxin family protein [Lentimicrobiaceae bacterium]|nr:thioredoxin family protein [Lentimicrobiaceae bacterium]MCB9023367.1 thioredoxin family protein [Lentimicrobiaceae bacterium]MCO5266163.1 thioredoxin family protein [Lentimicrobium sp.]
MKNIIITASLFLLIGLSSFAQGYQVGDKATDFKLKNIDDTFVSLKNYPDAKGFIVIFTCNHCPFSVAYEDRIISLDKEFKLKGYPVIAINPNDPAIVPSDGFDEMKLRAKEKGFTFPYLFDEGQKVFPVYGALRTPHVYVLQKVGTDLVVAYIGAIDDNSQNPESVKERFVEQAVNALLAGQKPQPDFTKAIGCSIKVADKN